MVTEEQSCTVLIVEDDPAVTEFMVPVLQGEGFSVRVAHTGGEALRQIEEARPDLILLDVLLPDMSGSELLARLRQQPGPEIPVILCTARREEADRAPEMEAAGVLRKPFSLDELVAAVRRVAGATTCPEARAPAQAPE